MSLLMRQIILFGWILLGLNVFSSYGQEGGSLTFEQLDSLQAIEKRPVLIFIHTSWCRYCQAMKHTTFQNQDVMNWLDSAFYRVSLDAETLSDITVREKTFRYQPTGNGVGQHELAQQLGAIEGILTYPTLCFLNTSYEIIYQQAGFLSASQLLSLLQTIHDHY